MTDYIVTERKGKTLKIPVKTLESIKEIKPLANENAWKILLLLGKKPAYPAEIAKKMGLHEQKIYYYINQLKNAGLVEVARTEEKQGALAKYYKPSHESFCLLPDLESLSKKKEFVFSGSRGKPSYESELLKPFINNGRLEAKIVLGSPDPHGASKARARDSHLAVELSAFFGSLASQIEFPLVFLDTQITSLENENSNLVVCGGPITNRLTEEINEKLPIKFVPSGGHWVVKSRLSGKEYSEDSIGVVEKVQHPYHKDKWILVVAGKRNTGTRAAITALIKNLDDLSKPNPFNEKVHARVVEGLDLDGDGTIDHAEIRE